MEFQEYARGLDTISEEDFARILLRYTCLSDSSVDEYLSRVRDRIAAVQVSPAHHLSSTNRKSRFGLRLLTINTAHLCRENNR